MVAKINSADGPKRQDEVPHCNHKSRYKIEPTYPLDFPDFVPPSSWYARENPTFPNFTDIPESLLNRFESNSASKLKPQKPLRKRFVTESALFGYIHRKTTRQMPVDSLESQPYRVSVIAAYGPTTSSFGRFYPDEEVKLTMTKYQLVRKMKLQLLAQTLGKIIKQPMPQDPYAPYGPQDPQDPQDPYGPQDPQDPQDPYGPQGPQNRQDSKDSKDL